jgi:tRNA 2-selenouridine synthase
MAHVLSEIGFRSSKLTGGYKSYRSEVQAFLKQDHNIKWCMLSGPTGSCKTRLLKRFEAAGHQVVDLEGLANHRGSVLGGMGEQPSQKVRVLSWLALGAAGDSTCTKICTIEWDRRSRGLLHGR